MKFTDTMWDDASYGGFGPSRACLKRLSVSDRCMCVSVRGSTVDVRVSVRLRFFFLVSECLICLMLGRKKCGEGSSGGVDSWA